MHKKPFLDTKVCLACERPFAWRKKWARNWSEVRYCSERCRRNKPGKAGRDVNGTIQSAIDEQPLKHG